MLLEKLTVLELAMEFSTFMGPEGSFPRSQQLVTFSPSSAICTYYPPSPLYIFAVNSTLILFSRLPFPSGML